MKANYKTASQNRLIEHVTQDILQQHENDFAKKHGIIPRVVVYEPFNRQIVFNIIVDHMTNTFYPLNKDEFSSIADFREATVKSNGDQINCLINSMEKLYNGGFFRSRPDDVYIYSNNNHDNLKSDYTLKHETFHAGLYDLIRGRISKLKIYRNPEFTPQFFQNLKTENLAQPLVQNLNNYVFNQVGNCDMVFHTYSFEEKFVTYNSICSMLEEEISPEKINVKNIQSLMRIYMTETGYQSKKFYDDVEINFFGNTIPLKSFFSSYLKTLRGPIEGYSQIDQKFASCIESPAPAECEFELLDSPIPELFDELLKVTLKDSSDNAIISAIKQFKIKQKTMKTEHTTKSIKISNNLVD